MKNFALLLLQAMRHRRTRHWKTTKRNDVHILLLLTVGNIIDYADVRKIRQKFLNFKLLFTLYKHEFFRIKLLSCFI
jgi:hypothetical protein